MLIKNGDIDRLTYTITLTIWHCQNNIIKKGSLRYVNSGKEHYALKIKIIY